jgi:hypothetical protein
VASDIDIHALYKYLLPNSFTLKSYFNKKNLVVPMFLLGINKEFAALGLHNILFSDDYKRNLIIYFQNNFQQKTLLFISILLQNIVKMMPRGLKTGL